MPETVSRPGYDRKQQTRGIVHFGLGAFTRAHQAAYTDEAMNAGDAGWMITGVSLRSPTVAQQMNPQDGLYLIAERSGNGTHYRLGKAIRDVLVASESPEAVIEALADPETRIVSFTVTEKGYCRAPDGSLDLELARQRSFYPLLANALRLRKETSAGGVTLLSCDNLAGNGAVLGRLMGQYLETEAADLVDWFAAHCTCPSTMVDRIVPATTDQDRNSAQQDAGLRDEALVVTEPFRQWVIEDRFAAGRPKWEDTGAQLVSNVAPYETAKLRMLNGAHSLLAYCGLQKGYTFVHEAIVDHALRAAVEALMAEAIPTIEAGPDQDLQAYAAALIERFANPALNHRLAQIAMDGSQKIPQRWLETLEASRKIGRSCPSIILGLSAWVFHLREATHVSDPASEELIRVAYETDMNAIFDALFGPDGYFSATWYPCERDRQSFTRMLMESSE
ncbi:mannitol dehydrogenase family protein [Erythrobacter aureus]|uniref:Mannitol dehydrogenase family protein n=1 Tax=Erythrobacter aureus TaxID=2182384 RepID=A0A345YHA4_9SPHN|nr:mannitol dehydrogenase family protein [Erythrobacter aureus]AXK43306.1 mannitol dehydrogenase family protein [Erythrobacter aureus]